MPQAAPGKNDDAAMKEWILRYAEQSSEDEAEEEGEKPEPDLEHKEKFDPVSQSQGLLNLMTFLTHAIFRSLWLLLFMYSQKMWTSICIDTVSI